jgi:hypothetical protein
MNIELLVAIIYVVLFFVLFALFLYQSISKHREAYTFTISLFFGTIAGILSIFDVIRVDLGINNRLLLFISLIIASCCYFLIYLFFEQLVTLRPKRVRLIVASILLFASIVFNQFFYYYWTYTTIEGLPLRILELSWDFSLNFLGIFIFTFGAYIHFQSYRLNRDVLPLIQALSLCLITIGFVLGLLTDLRVFAIPQIADVLKILGLFIFIIAYVIKIDYIYRLPVNVYFILTFSNTGLNIHIARIMNQNFINSNEVNEEIKGFNEKILSGVIVAIRNLLQESMGSRKKLESIVTGDRTIILDSGELATCAILCDKATYFLKNSLVKFRIKVENEFTDELQKVTIIKEDFETMDQIIKETFPFLILEKRKI